MGPSAQPMAIFFIEPLKPPVRNPLIKGLEGIRLYILT
jgi:hypothetical protein